MALPGGISPTDFENFPLSDFGRTVSRTPRTKSTDNITGRESWVTSSAVDITAVAIRIDKSWMFDETANIEGGDAYIMVKPDVTLSEGDLITFDGVVYWIRHLLTIYASDTAMFKYANLFIWSA